MKNPIITAILLFVTILTLTVIPSCTRVNAQSRAVMELDIAEAVYRYQMDHCYSGTSPKVWFLGNGAKDPSAEVLKRFNGHSPPVKGRSQMSENFKDRENGEKGILLVIEEPKWTSDTTVQVEGGCVAGPRAGHGSRYSLKREKSAWLVTAAEPTWIS